MEENKLNENKVEDIVEKLEDLGIQKNTDDREGKYYSVMGWIKIMQDPATKVVIYLYFGVEK